MAPSLGKGRGLRSEQRALNASVVLTRVCGRPARIMRPKPVRAMTARESAASLPWLIRSSINAGVRTPRSKRGGFSGFDLLFESCGQAKLRKTLCPLARLE